jgi:hypothetical protein
MARALTDTFAGIRVIDAPLFIVAEIGGAILATAFSLWLFAGAQEGAPTRQPEPARTVPADKATSL